MQTRKLSLLLVFFLFLSTLPLVYAYVFEDDFEVGNGYGAWTGTTTGGTGTLAIDTDPVHCGINSSRAFTTASGDVAYSYKTVSSGAIYYLRAYINWEILGTGFKYCQILGFYGATGYDLEVAIYNSVWMIRVTENYVTTNVAGTHTPSTGTWYCLEILRDVTNDNSTLWIDGNKEATSNTAISSNTVTARVGIQYTNNAADNALNFDCVVVDTSPIGLESSGKNVSFDLPLIPVVTTTLGRGIEIFKALSGAPAFTSSITYGLEWLFNLAEIPTQTATLVYGRALAFGLSEIPKFIADLAYEFQLKAGKNLYFNLSIIPQFIVDMTVQKGKELTFNLSTIASFIADLTKKQEIFRSLSETPKFIVDMTREIELAFVEFVLLEIPIFTATLGFLAETGMTTSDLANGAIALALIALIFALCGIGLAVKKTSD